MANANLTQDALLMYYDESKMKSLNSKLIRVMKIG